VTSEQRAAAPARAAPTRRALLVGAAAGVLGRSAAARAAPPSDVEQLERLLGLEHRLESAYEAALERQAIEPGLGQTMLTHEREHVRGLGLALRARGRSAARADRSPPPGTALADRPAFARYALGLESETVAAYQKALATLDNPRLLLPLASIMAAGAQHQVALRAAAADDLLAQSR
jgi:ferritin-like protein